MKLRDKLIKRMDDLQAMMESNVHLSDPKAVLEQLDTITYCWAVLDEEDRDYIHGVYYALENNTEWNV